MKSPKIKKEHNIYATVLEQEALDQFISAMEQPYAVKGALMPDAHAGYALPIGGVVATEEYVVPSWVGVDIGCGMCALKTTFNLQDIKDNSKLIYDSIYREVPTGFNVHSKEVESTLNSNQLSDIGLEGFKLGKGFSSLGTLGGGNHFIEIGYDEEEFIWIIIHSGSRGVGYKIANLYMTLAANGSKKVDWHYPLDVKSELGQKYLTDMAWCLNFALENRVRMLETIVQLISKLMPGEALWQDHLINRTHNHVELKDGLWIHRKGATHAEEGMKGVIPGNMRDGSFIVTGLGNKDSLYSSSHGAGRVLSRAKAKKTLDLEVFSKEMIGVIARVSDATLDESPLAYKNIFEVMELQKELVKVDHHVKPLINIKG